METMTAIFWFSANKFYEVDASRLKQFFQYYTYNILIRPLERIFPCPLCGANAKVMTCVKRLAKSVKILGYQSTCLNEKCGYHLREVDVVREDALRRWDNSIGDIFTWTDKQMIQKRKSFREESKHRIPGPKRFETGADFFLEGTRYIGLNGEANE